MASGNNNWSKSSWKEFTAHQQPTWPDQAVVDRVLNELEILPPLVFAGEIRSLKALLAKAVTGDAFLPRSLFKEVAELPFENAVGVLGFLLLSELNGIFRFLSPFTGQSMLSGRIVPVVERTVRAEDRVAESAGYLGFWTSVSCHDLCSLSLIGIKHDVFWADDSHCVGSVSHQRSL